MNLLSPAALWLAPVAAAIIALYLLKIKRRYETVPSLEFWRQLVSETQIRSLFRRLKRWLSLLLWLVIAACLLLAVGNPVFTSSAMKPQSIVVIIDNSASMQTIEEADGGRSRLELAKAAVGDILGQRPVSDEWLLIEASHQARVLHGFTRDKRAVLDTIDDVTPRTVRGDLQAAVALADQLLTDKDQPRILIVSDGAAGDVRKLAEADRRILHWPVGRSDDNLGITDINVRALHERSAHFVFLRITNASKADVEAQAVFEVDETTVKVEPLLVAGGEEWEKTVVIERAEGGVLRVSIDRADALLADNEAFAVLEPAEPSTVFLVSPPDESFFIEQALLAMQPLVDAETSQTLSLQEYEALGQLKNHADVVVFNNCVPETWPVGGGAVFINRRPHDIPARTTGHLANVRMDVTEPEHPLMRYLSFGSASIAAAERVEILQDAQVLARSADGDPLIFLYQRPERQALCLTFDVLETDLPFRTSFPLLLRNAVTFFTSQQKRWIGGHYVTHQVVESRRHVLPEIEEITVVRLTSAGSETETIPVTAGRFWFNGTGTPGVLRFEIGEDDAYCAINLNSGQESNIAPARPQQPAEDVLTLSRPIAGVVPWLAFAVAGGLLICTEWFTYHFRWTE